MSSSETASYALDAIHRISHRLDSVQDSLCATDRADSALAVANGQGQQEHDNKTAKIEASINLRISQSKSLLGVKQLDEALTSLRADGQPQTNTLLLTPPSQSNAPSQIDNASITELVAVARLTYATYVLLLDKLLKQAEQVNDQAWYWQEVEEDAIQTTRYFVQTLPSRIVNLVSVLANRLAESSPISVSSLNSGGVKEQNNGKDVRHAVAFNAETLARAWALVRESPNVAIAAVFPLSALTQQNGRDDVEEEEKGVGIKNADSKKKRVRLVSSARIFTPLGLTRHEARVKRAKLIKERDAMATQLGTLAQSLSDAEKKQVESVREMQEEIWARVGEMQSVLQVATDGQQAKQPAVQGSIDGSESISAALQNILSVQLSRQQTHLTTLLSAAPIGLGPPTRLARLWPTLVAGPLTCLITVRLITRNWSTIVEKASDARETVKGFLINWVYDPCIKLLDTIRTGDQDGVIITPESLNSDLQSLERMVSDFNKEKYGLHGEELNEVAARVRQGDLTTVLRIYEAELKSPLRSAISGSLIRSLLIQIQKVKVDIAVAMRGVDQLLKSQQLLFGAIGIAPAMAILYVTGGFLRSRIRTILLGGGVQAGSSKTSVQSARYRAWEAMRRIDRLLADPVLDHGSNNGEKSSSLPPLTQGLLLLDLALLRKLGPQLVAQPALGSKNARSKGQVKRLRAEFLRDVRDLETSNYGQGGEASSSSANMTSSLQASLPGLGWYTRRAAVDRMWKSWGGFMSVDRV